MASAFIDDGYTVTARVAAVDRLHPEVRFTYRPMTRAEFMAYIGECDGKSLAESEAIAAKWIAKHVKTWDVRHSNGAPVSITAANYSRLMPQVATKILGIVSGQEPTAPIDLETEAKNSETGCGSP